MDYITIDLSKAENLSEEECKLHQIIPNTGDQLLPVTSYDGLHIGQTILINTPPHSRLPRTIKYFYQYGEQVRIRTTDNTWGSVSYFKRVMEE